MLLQCMLIAALATGFADDDRAVLIVGAWTTTQTGKGVTVNVTTEFSKDGKTKITVSQDGKKDIVLEGMYKLEGNKLFLLRTANGKEDSSTFTIKELTKDTLVFTSADKKEHTLSRKK